MFFLGLFLCYCPFLLLCPTRSEWCAVISWYTVCAAYFGLRLFLYRPTVFPLLILQSNKWVHGGEFFWRSQHFLSNSKSSLHFEETESSFPLKWREMPTCGWVVVLTAPAYAAAVKTTTHPQTRCRKPYVATQNLMLLTMGVCARNMSN